MRRFLGFLVLVMLAAPSAWAGIPVTNTIFTDLPPPYLFPASGNPVVVGASATNTVTLIKGQGGDSLITSLALLVGVDFQVTGGTCVVNTTILHGGTSESCTVEILFTPTGAGLRTASLFVDCAPLNAPGGITIICDGNAQSSTEVALRGIGAILAGAVPALGRFELTALALLLFALAAWSLRRQT